MSLIPSINKYVTNVIYPADKQEIIAIAREQNAPEEVIQVLEQLPDQKYNGITELLRTIVSNVNLDYY